MSFALHYFIDLILFIVSLFVGFDCLVWVWILWFCLDWCFCWAIDFELCWLLVWIGLSLIGCFDWFVFVWSLVVCLILLLNCVIYCWFDFVLLVYSLFDFYVLWLTFGFCLLCCWVWKLGCLRLNWWISLFVFCCSCEFWFVGLMIFGFCEF